MTLRFATLLLTLGSAGLLLGVRVALWPLETIQLPATAPAQPTDASVTRASSTQPVPFIERDAFRLSRKASPVAYDPLRLTEQVVPSPPKPVLTLLGVVYGAEATAVVQGFGGIDGFRVVRVGDRVVGIVVKAIGPREVWLVGFDTTWVLRLRAP